MGLMFLSPMVMALYHVNLDIQNTLARCSPTPYLEDRAREIESLRPAKGRQPDSVSKQTRSRKVSFHSPNCRTEGWVVSLISFPAAFGVAAGGGAEAVSGLRVTALGASYTRSLMVA